MKCSIVDTTCITRFSDIHLGEVFRLAHMSYTYMKVEKIEGDGGPYNTVRLDDGRMIFTGLDAGVIPRPDVHLVKQ